MRKRNQVAALTPYMQAHVAELRSHAACRPSRKQARRFARDVAKATLRRWRADLRAANEARRERAA